MPFASVDGTRLYYRLEGNQHLPTLVLAHSIGCDHALWDEQLPDVLRHFRVLRYDVRGHGASDVPPGDYSFDRLARDVLGLADALGVDRFAFCGLSLGGMIGMRLAALAPERLTHLVLANTSPGFGDPAGWEARRRMVLEGGMAAVVEIALGRFFPREMIERRDPRVASVREVLLATDPVGYAGCCAAIRDHDESGSLRALRVPTLVIVGDRDVSTPWEGHGEVLAASIEGVRIARLPASHLANLHRPRAFLDALLGFLLPSPTDPLAAGFAARRAHLGDEYVDRAIARVTPFTADFQELITRYAWGSVWTRPGLDPRTRRLLVLAATASLGRWEEFRLHLRAGLRAELEPADLRETLLQLAVYAGVPAANTGFHLAAEELERLADEPASPDSASES